MTNLAAHTIGAVVDLAVVDNAAAHASAKGNGNKALAAAACTGIEFAEGSTVGIIFNIEGRAAHLMIKTAQRDIVERQVAGVNNRTAANFHRAGAAHTDGEKLCLLRSCFFAQIHHQGVERPCQRCRIIDGGDLHLLDSNKSSTLVHHARF